MIKKIHIDLSGIEDTNSLFMVFARSLSFPSYFGHNWDALYDMMNSLTTETPISKGMRYPLNQAHLIFDNFDDFRGRFPSEDFDIFTGFLVDISQVPQNRPGDISYTFETR